MTAKHYGYTSIPSSSRRVSFIAATPREGESATSIVGKLVYFDTTIDGMLHRSIGTVTDMNTLNTSLSGAYEGAIADHNSDEGSFPVIASDLRKSEMVIQAVFRRAPGGWEQANSALPTSPDTNRPVHVLQEDTVEEMLRSTTYPAVGYFRGLHAPLPFNIPNYDRSAYHVGVLGRSGSGKRLWVETPVPTPKGWTTMGQLQDGDEIFDELG